MFYVCNKHDSKIASQNIGKVSLTSVIVVGNIGTECCKRRSKRVKEANLLFTFLIIYLYDENKLVYLPYI